MNVVLIGYRGTGKTVVGEALSKKLEARILIWEAQPPRAATEATEALGLTSVIFEPMAGKGTHQTLVDALTAAVSDLAAAAGQSAD
jgi:hypothetical protein